MFHKYFPKDFIVLFSYHTWVLNKHFFPCVLTSCQSFAASPPTLPAQAAPDRVFMKKEDFKVHWDHLEAYK